jgi:hypothetical protein
MHCIVAFSFGNALPHELMHKFIFEMAGYDKCSIELSLSLEWGSSGMCSCYDYKPGYPPVPPLSEAAAALLPSVPTFIYAPYLVGYGAKKLFHPKNLGQAVTGFLMAGLGIGLMPILFSNPAMFRQMNIIRHSAHYGISREHARYMRWQMTLAIAPDPITVALLTIGLCGYRLIEKSVKELSA